MNSITKCVLKRELIRLHVQLFIFIHGNMANFQICVIYRGIFIIRPSKVEHNFSVSSVFNTCEGCVSSIYNLAFSFKARTK